MLVSIWVYLHESQMTISLHCLKPPLLLINGTRHFFAKEQSSLEMRRLLQKREELTPIVSQK
jgi:hypothetical protein